MRLIYIPWQRLRALSRRVHAEAAKESDPMPIAFPRAAQPPINNNTASRSAAAPPRSRKPSSSSSGIRAPSSGLLPSKSSSRAAQGNVTVGDLGQMEDGIAQVCQSFSWKRRYHPYSDFMNSVVNVATCVSREACRYICSSRRKRLSILIIHHSA